MLKYIKVTPLAAESLGVRSMCTYVETADVKILLDAGVSLCPNRFGLPPHPQEFKAMEESRKRIAEAAEKTEIITISHYHFDHHTPSFEDWLCNWTARDETARQIYADKTVLMKNPKEKINCSQRQRGWMFQKTSGKYAKKLENAEGRTLIFSDTVVRFSEPVFHGSENSFLGYVLMAVVESQGEKFMFAPDVQGPMSTYTQTVIIQEKPQLLMIGGPPLYLAGLKVDEEQAQAGLKNLQETIETVPQIILEHHILRDEKWREKTANVFNMAYKVRHTVLTAAEFLGKENAFLEAGRKRLFIEDPPSRDFEKWMRLNDEKMRQVKPQI
jgi:predicted metallo-beta-lactamase superfamily hydrolase